MSRLTECIFWIQKKVDTEIKTHWGLYSLLTVVPCFSDIEAIQSEDVSASPCMKGNRVEKKTVVQSVSPQLNVQALKQREIAQTVQCVYRYVQGWGGDWLQDFLWITNPQMFQSLSKGCTAVDPLDPHIQPSALSLDEGTGLYSSSYRVAEEGAGTIEDVALVLFFQSAFWNKYYLLSSGFSTTGNVGTAPYKPEWILNTSFPPHICIFTPATFFCSTPKDF